MSGKQLKAMPPGTLDQWRELLSEECAALVQAAAEVDGTSPAQVQRLRADWPAELVRLALELAAAQTKAREKFGKATARRMICDVTGVEQATSRLVAQHKAKRFATLQPDQIVDLCCGVGGDAMSLAAIAPTLAIDRSDVRAWMAGRNANCVSKCCDVRDVDAANAVVHIDPDRRAAAHGRRSRVWRFADYEPGPAFLEVLMEHARAVAVKLGPGVAFEDLPGGDATEVELISEHGRLVQAVLWTGELARNAGQRSATLLPGGQTFRGNADLPIRTDAIRDYVFTIDPAIERAGLLGALVKQRELPAVHRKVGLLTTNEFVDDPWLCGFAVRAVLPWRQTKVWQWLRGHSAGLVEVKTRGGIVDTDEMQRKLRGDGNEPFTVFVLRMDHKVFAIITQRISATSDRSAGVVD